MKQATDFQTVDMITPTKRRGRPADGGVPLAALTPAELAQRTKERAAARKAKSRAAKEDAGKVPVSFNISIEAMNGLREYMKFKDLTQDQVIERLLTTQLLRKR